MLVYGLFKPSFFQEKLQQHRIGEKYQKIYNPKNAEMTNWPTIRDYKTQNFMPRASRINLGESYLLLFLHDTRDWTYF